MAPSAVVTGQPGIGKSVWIFYALRRRLGEQKPVILYYADRCFLLVADGVYEKPEKILPNVFKRIVWTLVDSLGVFPNYLVEQGTRLFVIFTTSPNRIRWKDLNKSTYRTVCIMNSWSREEMDQLVSITDLDKDRTAIIYDTFGPTPRLWATLCDGSDWHQYESDVQAAIQDMTPSKLKELTAITQSLSMDAISHKIVLVARNDLADTRSGHTIAPITPNIEARIQGRFRYLKRLEIVELYQMFKKNPNSAKLAGMLFEPIGQRLLEENITLNIVPMVRLSNVPKGDPQWYSAHPELEASQENLTLEVKPTRVVEVGSDREPIEEGVYYFPKKLNEVAIDSFIVSGGFLYLFQFTVGAKHGVKPGLRALLRTFTGLPAEDNWRFVFVIPIDKQVIFPQPEGLGALPLYSAAIDVELYYKSLSV